MLAVHSPFLRRFNAFFPTFAEVFVKKRHPRRLTDSLSDRFYDVMLLEFAVKQGGGKIVEFAAFGQQSGGAQAVVITVIAAVLFAVNHILDKIFQLVAFLVDHLQIDLAGIGRQGLLPPKAFRVGMNVVPVKKAHHLQPAASERFDRVNGAGSAAYVQQDFQFLAPKMAVPIRTMVAPSSMAVSKSPVMPMDSSSMATLGMASSLMRFRSSRRAAKKGRTFSGALK